MNLTSNQTKYLHKVLSHYDWTKGREMSSTDVNNHQQVVAELNDHISRLEHPFPTYMANRYGEDE